MTRRCLQRQFLLRPSAATNALFLFVLAVAARRYGIQVHAFCVMSNHSHMVVTDPDARLPAFHQYLDALVARALNRSLKRRETFWGPGSFSAQRLMSPSDIVEKTAYVLANPVAAGLVRSGRLWPGLWSCPDRFGSEMNAERCDGFFADDCTLPRELKLALTPPPGFESAATFRAQVVARARRLERDARRRVGDRFLGAARVLTQSPFARPRSWEPFRTLRPRIAAGDATVRIAALAALRQFADDYRTALAKRRSGDLTAIFPAGTYLLRIQHAVPCAAPG